MIEKALEAFKENVENYQGDAEADASTEIVNLVQKFAGCCGYDGPADYAGKDLPTSCGDNKEGCNSVAPTKLGEHVIVAAGVALGAGAVMVTIAVINIYIIALDCCLNSVAGSCKVGLVNAETLIRVKNSTGHRLNLNIAS